MYFYVCYVLWQKAFKTSETIYTATQVFAVATNNPRPCQKKKRKKCFDHQFFAVFSLCSLASNGLVSFVVFSCIGFCQLTNFSLNFPKIKSTNLTLGHIQTILMFFMSIPLPFNFVFMCCSCFVLIFLVIRLRAACIYVSAAVPLVIPLTHTDTHTQAHKLAARTLYRGLSTGHIESSFGKHLNQANNIISCDCVLELHKLQALWLCLAVMNYPK